MNSTEFTTPDTGRADVIPGYILSKPGYAERALAEHEIVSRFMAGMSALIAALPEALAREGLLIGFGAVKHCELREGTSANEVWMKTLEMAPFLTWLCLKVKHPQLTLEKTCELFAQHNPDEIALATWQLWGLISPADQAIVQTGGDAPAVELAAA